MYTLKSERYQEHSEQGAYIVNRSSGDEGKNEERPKVGVKPDVGQSARR